jgi:hypothetical protein
VMTPGMSDAKAGLNEVEDGDGVVDFKLATFTSTCPGPGSGTGTWARTSRPPSCTRPARITAAEPRAPSSPKSRLCAVEYMRVHLLATGRGVDLIVPAGGAGIVGGGRPARVAAEREG